jgi:hydrogenase nickel incorporation protein HypA/HybF
MTQLLEMVQGEAARVGAQRVVDINLVIGDRTNVVDDSLLFCFELLAADTVAEGAQIHIRRTVTEFQCQRDGSYTPADHDFRCPRCQEVGRMTERGSELVVESIEVET